MEQPPLPGSYRPRLRGCSDQGPCNVALAAPAPGETAAHPGHGTHSTSTAPWQQRRRQPSNKPAAAAPCARVFATNNEADPTAPVTVERPPLWHSPVMMPADQPPTFPRPLHWPSRTPPLRGRQDSQPITGNHRRSVSEGGPGRQRSGFSKQGNTPDHVGTVGSEEETTRSGAEYKTRLPDTLRWQPLAVPHTMR